MSLQDRHTPSSPRNGHQSYAQKVDHESTATEYQPPLKEYRRNIPVNNNSSASVAGLLGQSTASVSPVAKERFQHKRGHRLPQRAPVALTMNFIRKYIDDSLNVVRKHRRANNICNVGLYGTTLACMALATFRPELTEVITKYTDAELDAYAVGRLVKHYYDSGQMIPAAAMTFGINLAVGAFGSITLPTIFLPFTGLCLQVYRMGYWGILFPVFHEKTHPAHLLTMVMEGQAYILAALGSWIMGKAAVDCIRGWWETNEVEKGNVAKDWTKMYWGSVKESMRLYPLIGAILGVSALWEAWEVIYFTL